MKHKMITICITVVKPLSSLVSVARSLLNLINDKFFGNRVGCMNLINNEKPNFMFKVSASSVHLFFLNSEAGTKT